MTRYADGPGLRPPGPSQDTTPAGRRSAVIVPPGDGGDPAAAKLWRLRDHYGYLTRAEFGERPPARPSSYSLTTLELAAHVRQLRRAGWQSWEVRARFDFGMVASAA